MGHFVIVRTTFSAFTRATYSLVSGSLNVVYVFIKNTKRKLQFYNYMSMFADETQQDGL